VACREKHVQIKRLDNEHGSFENEQDLAHERLGLFANGYEFCSIVCKTGLPDVGRVPKLHLLEVLDGHPGHQSGGGICKAGVVTSPK
jgi:hypothetical protein